MKNKKDRKAKIIRARHQRVGALLLAVMTLLGSSAVTKVNRSFYREVTVNPAFAFSQITERENETARITVRYDIGIHSPISGGR